MTEKVVDLSYHKEPRSVDYQLMKGLGIELVVVKYSMGGGEDSRADEHSALVREHGLGLGGYHWVDPIQDWERQCDYFMQVFERWQPEFVMYDVEQWWASWSKWNQWLDGLIPNDQVPRASEFEVVESFITVYENLMRMCGLDDERHIVYSAEWFTDMYPDLVQAIREFPGKKWWADSTQVWLEDWYLDEEEWEWLWDEWLIDREPDRPDNTEWDIWQVQSRLVPPNFRTRLDLNKPSESFANLLKKVYNLNGEPEPEQPVNITPYADFPPHRIKPR